ncbi:MAG: hypothetical protein K2Y02_05200 [Burkholderiaceae bacterium]|nr:hypothetical protein [Burkholderiaceae bacterium]
MDVDKIQQLPGEMPVPTVDSGLMEPLSDSALARRRAVFKGIGKGGAVLAASVPIKTLAGQRILTNGGAHQCSVSGMQSGVHSAGTNDVYCDGYDCDHWGKKDPVKNRPLNSWPSGCTYTASCSSVFPNCGFPNRTLFEVICPSSSYVGTVDQRQWICSWLNASLGAYNYPHSPQQVIAFCSPSHPQRTDALAFYKYINKRA